MSMTANSNTSSEVVWPSSTATATSHPISSWPEGPTRALCTAIRARWGASFGSSRLRRAKAEITAVTGAYPLDIDSDGIIDLAVLRVGENVVLRGLGDCSFEPANELWDIDGGDDWTVAFSATWEGEAQLPTLGVRKLCRVWGRMEAGTAAPTTRSSDPRAIATCHPRGSAPDGARCRSCSATGTGSGRRDLRMTNDRHYYRDGEEQLWRVEPDQPIRLYTREEGWQPMKIWGMGIASYDLTGDGLPEIFLTSQSDNKLQTLADGASSPTLRGHGLPSRGYRPPTLRR